MTMTSTAHVSEAEKYLSAAEAQLATAPAAGPKRAEALRDAQVTLLRALAHATLAEALRQH